MAHNEHKADLSGTHFVPPHQNPPPYVTQPQPGIYPAYPAVPPQQVVAVVPVVRQMGPDPSHYTCPSCNTAIVTRVERVSTTKTHLFAALLCLIGCWPCVCIPYCTNSCQNAEHYCPNCSAYIGNYSS